MKRSAIVVAAFAGLLVGCRVDSVAPPTGGQGRFIVRGTVTNLAGTPMSNVTVQIQPLNGGTVIRTMQTGTDGAYRTFGLAAGLYRAVVVMGDSSRITTVGIDKPPGLREPVTVGQTDSTIVPVLAYDPGKVISGSLTYSIQTPTGLLSVPLRGVRVRLKRRTATTPAPGVFTQIDSQRTSATGGYRFPIRVQTGTGSVLQFQFDTTEAAIFPNGFRAAIDTTINTVNLLDTLRVTNATLTPSGGVINATAAASNSLTFRAPYVIRARIFKDRCTPQPCTPDGVYLVNASNPDSIVSGIRFWLRTAGRTSNLGTGTVTSGTSTAATGNVSFTGLKNDPNWTLHIIRWYLPAGNCYGPSVTLTAEGDLAVTPDFAPLTTSPQTVPTKDIPLINTGCP